MPRPELEPFSDFAPAFAGLRCLRVGTVLEDEDGRDWVFVGWRRNTARHEAVFCEIFDENRFYGMMSQISPHIYHASGYDTLCRKFPKIEEIENAQRPNLY
jgi:hypothetical protein